MKKYNKIYLLSDIHGYIEGLMQVSKLATKQNPVFVLGDLLDHQFGYEREIINTILDLSNKECLYLIYGNHDIYLRTLFFKSDDLENDYKSISKEKNRRKLRVLHGLFDQDFYNKYIEYIDALPPHFDELKVLQFYDQVTTLCNHSDYIDIYNKLIRLFTIGAMYEEVVVGNYKILLSHSGEVDDSSSRNTMRHSFKLNQKYDFGVMGHLTIPYIEKMIEEESNMIDYSYISKNKEFKNLKICGSYNYNHCSKMILIDDGTYKNIVSLEYL